MKIRQCKITSVCIFILISGFAALAAYAETGQAKNSDWFYGERPLLVCNGQASAEQITTFDKQERSKSEKIIAEVWGGILGNALGGLIGAGVLLANEGNGGEIIFFGASALGSALGVYSAGNSENVNARGRFGMTLLGSLLGELAVIGLSSSNEDGISIIPAIIFPVIGAVVGYNISLTSRSRYQGNALLNLNEGKLALGIPDVHIRRMQAKAENAKPAFAFNVRVFSVEL